MKCAGWMSDVSQSVFIQEWKTFRKGYLCQSILSLSNVGPGSGYGLLRQSLGALCIHQCLLHLLRCVFHPLSTMPKRAKTLRQAEQHLSADQTVKLCCVYLALLASSSSFSVFLTSSCVCCRMASTFERLWTRSLISSARSLIWKGEAGMESCSTWLATASMLSGSAPSSVGNQQVVRVSTGG